MSGFEFEPEPRPFARWMGPFSPARGNYSGFRFHRGRPGTWVEDGYGRTFWPVLDGRAARRLARLVRHEWGGGRILFLPNGLVVKPLQGDLELGRRVLIGHFSGPIVLEVPDSGTFDLNRSVGLEPGDPWRGPRTTGLECTIAPDGSLSCRWYHPARFGRDGIFERLRGADRSLAKGFRRARPGDLGGRVRVTANGAVITNRQERHGSWVSHYVGRVDPSSWGDWQEWIRREKK